MGKESPRLHLGLAEFQGLHGVGDVVRLTFLPVVGFAWTGYGVVGGSWGS